MTKNYLGWIFVIVIYIFLMKKSTTYTYEICDNSNVCTEINIAKISPSIKKNNICDTSGKCELVPINQLLFKTGTDKKYCSNASYLQSDYVDNYWNSEGLIDECEMPINSNMQFIFKQHNQEILSYSGTIQIAIKAINYETLPKALQVYVSEDNNGDNLPDLWIHCGNVNNIIQLSTKLIQCSGNNLKFVKLLNPSWNTGNLYIDYIEVLKV